MKESIVKTLNMAAKDLFGQELTVELTRPEAAFGDYATNVALQLAGKLVSPPAGGPREIAEKIAEKLKQNDNFEKVEVAGPGFINIWLSDQHLFEISQNVMSLNQPLTGKNIVFEYSDPNPFKVLHAGHLYQTIVGDAIANMLEVAGAKVHRVNFGGDVGLHVGKTMWAILDTLSNSSGDEMKAYENLLEVSKKSLDDRTTWLSVQYVKGNEAYETNEESKTKIIAINKKVYHIHAVNDHETNFAKIYWTTRQWSYDYFDAFYASIGSGFEKYYPESLTAPIGLKTVQEQLKNGVYEESDGAIVFKGEPYGLHTRVFINSECLPTYEAKDVGLTMAKWQDYHFDQTIIITGNDILEYMKVVLKSIEQFEPELVKRTAHFTHGQVKLAGGTKMSSRKGNILRAQDVLDVAAEAGKNLSMDVNEDIVLGAVKYAFIKQTMGPDIIYNPEESISIHGNSGPYLQYALVRARAVLRKIPTTQDGILKITDGLDEFERNLARQLSGYPEAFGAALHDYSPHHIANYLYELAQEFNRFYENSRVAGDPRETLRVQLVKTYEIVLANGLTLLGIPTPDKM